MILLYIVLDSSESSNIDFLMPLFGPKLYLAPPDITLYLGSLSFQVTAVTGLCFYLGIS